VKKDPSISEQIIAFLEAHPGSRMGAVQQHILSLGLSTEKGIQSIMYNLVNGGALKVDRTNYKAFRYSVNDETRHVSHVDAARFEVPAELAGPVVPPMVWSMRHLLGASL